MGTTKTGKSTIKVGYQLSEQMYVAGKPGKYEIAFRRWVVREIQAGRMTVGEFGQQFGIEKQKSSELVRYWTKQYGNEMLATLPVMDEKERARLEALEKHNKQLIKQLEDAQMRNIVLETLIDVAEEDLKINIRKKRGPKP